MIDHAGPDALVWGNTRISTVYLPHNWPDALVWGNNARGECTASENAV